MPFARVVTLAEWSAVGQPLASIRSDFFSLRPPLLLVSPSKNAHKGSLEAQSTEICMATKVSVLLFSDDSMEESPIFVVPGSQH